MGYLGCGTCSQEVRHERRQWRGGGAIPRDIGLGSEQAVGLCEGGGRTLDTLATHAIARQAGGRLVRTRGHRKTSRVRLYQDGDDAPSGSQPLDALHALARGRGRGGLEVAGAAKKHLDRTATHARL